MSLFVQSNASSIHPAMVAAEQAKTNPLEFLRADAVLDAAAEKRTETIVRDLVASEAEADIKRRMDQMLAEASAEVEARIADANATIAAERAAQQEVRVDADVAEDSGGLESLLAGVFGDPSVEHLDMAVSPAQSEPKMSQHRPYGLMFKLSEPDPSSLLDARLMGIARDGEPESSYLIESYDKSPGSRMFGGAVGAGAGALGGMAAARGLEAAATRNPGGRAAGLLGRLLSQKGVVGRMGARGLLPLLGGVLGGGLGATALAPRPSIMHNLGTGERLSPLSPERMQVSLLNRQLDPGSDPTDVSVFNADSVIGDRFPGQSPLDYGYAIDLDDALTSESTRF